MSTGVETVGLGLVTAIPDVAVVELGAHANAGSVTEALDRANAGMDAARRALLAAGVAERDLVTAGASTWADHPEPGRTTAQLTVRAIVREPARVGEITRAALDAAGDVARLDSVSFAVEDSAPLAVTAREVAFEDARAKAEQYALLAGRRLGAVVAVRESGDGAVPLVRTGMALAADALAVEPGTQDVRAAVTVRWELID